MIRPGSTTSGEVKASESAIASNSTAEPQTSFKTYLADAVRCQHRARLLASRKARIVTVCGPAKKPATS